MGKVYLVGAGPGDAGLITVKGLEKLKKCDAVVYDRLIAEELLDVLSCDCIKIYVGKEAGKHYKKQSEINDILVECARKYTVVVRLKGGDPFVFGRGGEEIEALSKNGIPYEVIPGVTSAVAVPESAGIPVTHRGVARSFHVITGHINDSERCPDYDFEVLGKLEGTLVFLMGLSNLKDITDNLLAGGKPADTPVAVISNGATAYQKIVRGTLRNIEARVKESSITSPAIIVIGKTAEYEYKYSSPSQKRAGIISTQVLWEKLESGFEKLGMDPVYLCNMKVVPSGQMHKLDEELYHLDRYDWIIFTSQNAIVLFFNEIKNKQTDIRILGNIKFAVLGTGTAENLLEYGIRADFIPSAYNIAAFGEEFVRVAKQKEKILIPRAVQGSKELTDILSRKNFDYLDLAIYDVIGSMTNNIQYLNDLDYLIFVSASGVTAFFEELERRELQLPENIRIACIGKITERKLLERYGKADIVATVNSVEGLLDKLKSAEE